MGGFAGTANLDYRLSFVGQEKQTSVTRSIKINRYIYIYIYTLYLYIYIYIYIHIYFYKYILPFQSENGKKKPRRHSLIRSPFAQRANGSFRSSVFLRWNKQKLSVCKWTERTKRTCPSMEISIVYRHNCKHVYHFLQYNPHPRMP